MLVLVSTWTAGGREVDGADFLFCWFSLSLSFGMIASGSSRFSFLFNFFAIDLLSDLFRFMPRFFKCSSLFCSLMTHSRGSIGGNGVAPIASPFVKDFHSFFSPIVSLVTGQRCVIQRARPQQTNTCCGPGFRPRCSFRILGSSLRSSLTQPAAFCVSFSQRQLDTSTTSSSVQLCADAPALTHTS